MSELTQKEGNVVLEEHIRAKENSEIDLLAIMQLLLHHIWILIAAFVVGALIAGVGTKFFITPQYESFSQIYIFSKSTSVASFTDLQLSTQLTEDFRLLGTTRPVIEEVINQLNLDTDYDALVSSVSITNPADTHYLKIVVTNPDPELAADVCNTLSNVLRDRIAEVMNTDRPSTVEPAVVSDTPSSPNLRKNVAVGGLICLLLAVAVLLVQYFLDDTIKDSDDVERYLKLNTIASIPLERNVDGRPGRVTKKLFSKKKT